MAGVLIMGMFDASWTPIDGTMVRLGRHNCWQLPAGCYRLAEVEKSGRFDLDGSGMVLAVATAELQWQHRNGHLNPIDPAELERQRQALTLRTAAPLRSTAPQADVDGLALFDLARSPAFI